MPSLRKRCWPLCFIESAGDNLAATFSPELADLTIDVIDVAAGEKIPRKRLVLDFLFAWLFGILFQYLTIVPMRRLSFGKGLLEAAR